MSKFYGVGVGPGDPELITLKALKVLKKADLIFSPKAKMKEDSLAREIVEKVLDEKKDIIEIEFPMTKNVEELKERYLNSARIILQKVKEGKDVAYLTIGDPLLYSTYIYLIDALKELSPELKIETIPGIPAYSAVAARFDYSLAEKDERICICPVSSDMEDLREIITKNDTIVIMKVAKMLPQVINLLSEMNLLSYSIFGSHVGMEGERLINGAKEPFMVSEKEGYLSTIIVRKR
ncbi:MAG: precorrin-2 C(20)-methyltransferase [Nitrospinae bacterium RIFCSPLOWO2_02_39_17]|nr:MAG: precorrin-2 C(20)-methyltransferase [Nitrospinae bacterium RIFCSPHIGHO2_02_39_11]OGV98705.1 MAG: precorrin-2 C(20)-methyltransferase [Nitrospinae bacterium RIFCSPHIGHO2_12_FULL_39_42]OGW02717.1 MAG: precorrin-2 C(20)-methyltransferase [Nitrospinae bacterium RIFCSPHIGHO2_02_FULL_39_82]OGW07307.1 MAG: precorrin-2 C(20)-methyltransferase [Nitrospinae bacterium RIFCSPLOWO2_02_39_17]OGW11291.1 MAG: precorrin-2 C(20)-methyltransferase [Nitrospinae bacterium RIFCSPLOWO2_12_39_15]OHB91312.1 MA